jgi:hypothetical protein
MSFLIRGTGTLLTELFNMDLPEPAIAAITTTAVSLATLFFAMQFISELAAFRMDRIEEAIRVCMKVIIAKIVLENSAAIADMIYNLFWNTSLSSFTEALNSLADNYADVALVPPEPGIFGINNILALMTTALPVFLVTAVTLASLILTITGIFFEINIHKCVAPLALSTLVNDTTRSTGIAFIKSYSAVCLQLTLISVCINVYVAIGTALNSQINSMINDLIGATIFGQLINALVPLLMFICLSTSIKKSGDITKRMLGA